ncbi:MAG: hypothetical protein AAF688_10865 [Bacteroidota bacterium]
MIIRLLTPLPFSSLILTLSCLLLSLLYFRFGFAILNNVKFKNIFKKSSERKLSNLRVLGTVFTGFLLSLLVIYMLFKFQRWPYGDYGLLVCLSGLSIIAVVCVVKFAINKDGFYKTLLLRLILIGTFGLILFLTSEEKLLEVKFRHNPEYVEIEKQLIKDPENTELREKSINARRKEN